MTQSSASRSSYAPAPITVSRESVVDAAAVCGSCGGIAEGEALAAELGGVLQDPGEHWHGWR